MDMESAELLSPVLYTLVFLNLSHSVKALKSLMLQTDDPSVFLNPIVRVSFRGCLCTLSSQFFLHLREAPIENLAGISSKRHAL